MVRSHSIACWILCKSDSPVPIALDVVETKQISRAVHLRRVSMPNLPADTVASKAEGKRISTT